MALNLKSVEAGSPRRAWPICASRAQSDKKVTTAFCILTLTVTLTRHSLPKLTKGEINRR